MVALSAAVQPDGDQCQKRALLAQFKFHAKERRNRIASDCPAVPFGQYRAASCPKKHHHFRPCRKWEHKYRQNTNPVVSTMQEFPVPQTCRHNRAHQQIHPGFSFFRTCSISQTPKGFNRNVQRTFW